MHFLESVLHWLHADPPSMYHLMVALFTILFIWIAFERMSLTARKFR